MLYVPMERSLGVEQHGESVRRRAILAEAPGDTLVPAATMREAAERAVALAQGQAA